MGLTIRPFECGWLNVDYSLIVPGHSGQVRVPVPAFLIEHPKGLVLFDLGLHSSLVHSSERIGKVAAVIGVEMTPEARLTAQLAAVGHDPADIALAVPSHLHWDHVGGLSELPDSTLVLQAAEWTIANDPPPGSVGYIRQDFDLGHARKLLEGSFDLFGDGALTIVPTPGHTAGHQSLLVEGRTLLVGDACNCQVALDEDAVLTASYDIERARQTFAWLRQRQADGVRLVYSHDYLQWPQVKSGITSVDG